MKKAVIKLLTKTRLGESFYLCYKGRNNVEFMDWLKKYKTSNVIEYKHLGENHPKESFYYSEFNNESFGFFALWKLSIQRLDYCERYQLTPFIKWGKNLPYYEESMNANIWENYFCPINTIDENELMQSANVVYSRGVIDCGGSFDDANYAFDEGQIKNYVYYHKKYFKLLPHVEDSIMTQINSLLKGKNTLAVHIRGVEWGNIANHPQPITMEKYAETISEALGKNHFEQIFVASDSDDAIEYMRNKFGSKVVYYDDVARAKKGSKVLAIFDQSNSGENVKYNMGIEVLRDMMTLSTCDGLIAGYSNISLAAYVWKRVNDLDYAYLNILRSQINRGGISAEEAVRRMKQVK